MKDDNAFFDGIRNARHTFLKGWVKLFLTVISLSGKINLKNRREINYFAQELSRYVTCLIILDDNILVFSRINIFQDYNVSVRIFSRYFHYTIAQTFYKICDINLLKMGYNIDEMAIYFSKMIRFFVLYKKVINYICRQKCSWRYVKAFHYSWDNHQHAKPCYVLD